MKSLYFAGAVILAALDQVTKAAAHGYLVDLPEGQAVRLIAGVLYLKTTVNAGGIWGLLDGVSPWFFAGLSAAFVAYLIALIARLREPEHGYLPALALLLGGFAGNGIDRVRAGHVTDFIYITAGPRWLISTFNLADLAILAGAVWLAARFVSSRLRRGVERGAEP